MSAEKQLLSAGDISFDTLACDSNDTEMPKSESATNYQDQSFESYKGVADQITDTQPDAIPNITLKAPDLKQIAVFLKDSYRAEINETIGEAIANTLDRKIEAITSKIVDGVLAGFQQRVEDLESENKSMRQEISDLKTKVESLEQSADASEQYSRRNCLRITGVPEKDDKEQTDDHVLKMCTDLQIPVTIKDIDRSHRVGRKMTNPGSKPRAIIVKFATYRARQILYKARTKLKVAGFAGVYINEDLTRKRDSILFQARQLVKSGRIEDTWTSDGTILVKDKDFKIVRIQAESDLTGFE